MFGYGNHEKSVLPMCVYRSRPRRIQATAKYESLGELAIYLSFTPSLSPIRNALEMQNTRNSEQVLDNPCPRLP